MDTGYWHQASTGSDQLAEVTTRALDIYESIRIKVTAGLVIKNKNFKRLALEQLDIGGSSGGYKRPSYLQRLQVCSRAILKSHQASWIQEREPYLDSNTNRHSYPLIDKKSN